MAFTGFKRYFCHLWVNSKRVIGFKWNRVMPIEGEKFLGIIYDDKAALKLFARLKDTLNKI
jgi:hypothetical protein